jgi:hypothetical protein
MGDDMALPTSTFEHYMLEFHHAPRPQWSFEIYFDEKIRIEL